MAIVREAIIRMTGDNSKLLRAYNEAGRIGIQAGQTMSGAFKGASGMLDKITGNLQNLARLGGIAYTFGKFKSEFDFTGLADSEDTMYKLQLRTLATKEEMKSLKDNIDVVGQITGKTNNEVSGITLKMGQFNTNVKQLNENLVIGARSSAKFGEDLGITSETANKLFLTFGLRGPELAKAMNQLGESGLGFEGFNEIQPATITRLVAAGQSFESIVKSALLLKSQGLGGGRAISLIAQTQLEAIQRAGDIFGPPSEMNPLARLYKMKGLDINKQSLIDIIKTVESAIPKNASPELRNKILEETLGSSGLLLANLLRRDSEAYNKALKRMNESSNELSGGNDRLTLTFGRLNSNIEDTKESMAGIIINAPKVRDSLESLSKSKLAVGGYQIGKTAAEGILGSALTYQLLREVFGKTEIGKKAGGILDLGLKATATKVWIVGSDIPLGGGGISGTGKTAVEVAAIKTVLSGGGSSALAPSLITAGTLGAFSLAGYAKYKSMEETVKPSKERILESRGYKLRSMEMELESKRDLYKNIPTTELKRQIDELTSSLKSMNGEVDKFEMPIFGTMTYGMMPSHPTGARD